MAEEEEGGGGEAGGSVLKKWGPLAAIVLLVQVVVAWALLNYVPGLLDKDKEQEDSLATERPGVVARKDKNDEELPYYYQNDLLNSIAANPAGTNGEKFVVFDVELGLAGTDDEGNPFEDDEKFEDEAFIKKMDKFMPRIKSIITETMRSKTVDQLEGEFFKDVKQEMKKRLTQEVFDKIFKKDDYKITVKDVNVSRLVIQ